MYNFYQSNLRRTINQSIYQKPTCEVSIGGVSYQGIIREKKVLWWTLRRVQILGVSLPPLNKDSATSLRHELSEIAKKNKAFFVQLGITDIISQSSTPDTLAYQEASKKLREDTKKTFTSLGFRCAIKENLPPATYIIDTTNSEKDAREKLSSHHRTKIRKAQKAGIEIRIAHSDEYDMFFDLLVSTGRIKGFGVISRTSFKRLIDFIIKDNCGHLYVSFYQGRMIGGALYLIDESSHYAVYLYGCSDRSVGNIGGNHYLHRSVIRDLHTHNVAHVDMLGGGPTGYPNHHLASVGNIKEGFGGKKLDYCGSFDYIHYSLIYTIRRFTK